MALRQFTITENNEMYLVFIQTVQQSCLILIKFDFADRFHKRPQY